MAICFVLTTTSSPYHYCYYYYVQEQEVLGRIRASIEDPLGLEVAGHAIFDLYPERRGNLFSDEVYRLTKAKDATAVYNPNPNDGDNKEHAFPSYLPPNSKFSNNDVILLTLQEGGSGDFFDPNGLPTSATATSMEARVIATGPTYVDIAVAGGSFEAAFGPAPNNVGPSGPGSPKLRLRADRFFSEVPYTRMVAAVSQITAIPERSSANEASTNPFDGLIHQPNSKEDKNGRPTSSTIRMDDVLRDAILSTHAFTDPVSSLFHDVDSCDLQQLDRLLAKAPLGTQSVQWANQALTYMQQNPHRVFPAMNGPQLAAVGAALTRKLTLIQGPPGSGKTSTAGAIGFGFVHQCRQISPHSKVLACAFSNVGADNLAETLLKLGLKVVRVGKASAMSEHLWQHSLDAAIDADPKAQQALEHAARATARLAAVHKSNQQKKSRKSSRGGTPSDTRAQDKVAQELATAAVQASIRACNQAAAKALREADVIVSTSTGAADPRLLAACGLNVQDDEEKGGRRRVSQTQGGKKTKADGSSSTTTSERTNAPDGLPPLSLPFVMVDEACQSVEPATLIPVTASNSCRSLVLLGDPCQLPATVKSDPESLLAISLMERLSATLPAPVVRMKQDHTPLDTTYLDSLPIKQARSLLRTRKNPESPQLAYRKRFAGSILLGIQYRMHPSIAAVSSALFYDSLLGTPDFVGTCRPFPKMLQEILPSTSRGNVRFVNVGGRCNESRGEANQFTRTVYSDRSPTADATQESTTYNNRAEAMQVVELVRHVLQEADPEDPFSPKTIGIVTPYTGQVQLIKNLIAQDATIRSLLEKNISIEVKSVDGYQGRERDVVILSAVRSNHKQQLGFVKDWRRLNVALTRARNALVVVGDLETLKGDPHWAALAKWCEGEDCIVEAES